MKSLQGESDIELVTHSLFSMWERLTPNFAEAIVLFLVGILQIICCPSHHYTPSKGLNHDARWHSIHGPCPYDYCSAHLTLREWRIFAKIDASGSERWCFRYLRPLAGDRARSTPQPTSVLHVTPHAQAKRLIKDHNNAIISWSAKSQIWSGWFTGWGEKWFKLLEWPRVQGTMRKCSRRVSSGLLSQILPPLFGNTLKCSDRWATQCSWSSLHPSQKLWIPAASDDQTPALDMRFSQIQKQAAEPLCLFPAQQPPKTFNLVSIILKFIITVSGTWSDFGPLFLF